MERINKLYTIVGLIITCGLFFALAAQAGEVDEATTISFSASVEIPGQVLPAGTYLFKRADNGAEQNFVQIFDSDGIKLFATVPTIPTERLAPTGNTTLTLAEQESGAPDALLKWFYPGSLTGHEFMYSARENKKLAEDRQQTINGNSTRTNSETQAGD